jgi:endoglucanase
MATALGQSGRRGMLLLCLAHFTVIYAACGSSAQIPGRKRLTQPRSDNYAFEQNKRLGRGINILGYDPIWTSPDKARFQAKFFKLIRDAGFDHVRVNIHPFRDGKPDGVISDYYWKTLDWTIQQALENNLAVILDFHEFLEMGKDPKAKTPRFLDTWKQIAERYKDVSDDVYFELLNEPCEQLTSKLWNRLLREALAVVRETNPDRTVIVGPGRWNSLEALEELDLPQDDQNLIVTVHYYNPFEFTHQGALWTEHKKKSGIIWKGDEQEHRAIVRDFDRVQAWSKRHSRPIYLGEFGAYDKADMASRVRYLAFVAREAEKRGWSWAYWQFDSNFILYDVAKQQWVRPILDALIPLR